MKYTFVFLMVIMIGGGADSVWRLARGGCHPDGG